MSEAHCGAGRWYSVSLPLRGEGGVDERMNDSHREHRATQRTKKSERPPGPGMLDAHCGAGRWYSVPLPPRGEGWGVDERMNDSHREHKATQRNK
jgi:hypothetical protein